MSTTKRVVHATPERVWAVLADGWLFPLWVVGAARMRAVDAAWPALGTRLHHSVGPWPLLLDDETEVTETQPGSVLGLRAKAWPLGEASVTLRLRPVGADTEVTIDEHPVGGPGALLPSPMVDPLLRWRNTETLRRLALIAEGGR